MKNTFKQVMCSVLALVMTLSALLGTTFAWFTDAVTSSGNIIASGKLDAEMYWSDKLLAADSDEWNNADGTSVFNYNNWEPGYTEVRYVKVSNAGTLNFRWKLSIEAEGNVTDLSDVINVYYVNPVTAELTKEGLKSLTPAGTLTDVLENNTGLDGRQLTPDSSVILAIAFHMDELADNKYQNKSLCDAGFSLKLLATQDVGESDSFGDDYDKDATFPDFDNTKVSVPVGEVDGNNNLTQPMTIQGSVNATIPAGVKIAEGTTELTLSVGNTERSTNIDMTMGEVSRSLDVHIDGISEDNTVPMIIDLGAVLPVGYKEANISLYHVEDGVANKMNLVDTPALHNDFSYNAATGEVSIALASFSEVTAVVAAGDPWAGGVDISWYNTTDTEFTLTNEDQFAGFAAIVGGMAKDANENEIWDTFEGKTVKLDADLNLGSENNKIFTPVGYRFTDDNNKNGIPNDSKEDISSNVYSFEGIFDGQNHTIANILQRTWDIKGDDPHYSLPNEQYYNDGMGIFGFVYNGTVKNLVVNNFQSDGEFSTTGCVAAYASGTSTFDNIKIVNSNPRAYNVPNGGVVGYAYNQSGSTATINFNNITVDSSNKITALWGSWDVGCGGILGRVNGDTTVNMNNCTVGAVIDVYNDVCGNYQYYQYRYAGMLVGTVGGDTDPLTGGEKVNFSNVKVYIGNWADYYYCEFEKNTVGSYTTDFQFSRVEKNEINIDPATNLPYNLKDEEGKFLISPCRHKHTENEDKMGTYLPFDQLYTGYGWGSSPVKSADGVEVIKYFYTVTYMDGKGDNVLATEYVTTGERSENKLWANAHTVKNGQISENPSKIFKGWVNTASAVTTSISAGNYKDVVLYESWDNPFVARFVDKDGNVIYSETFMRGDTTISEPEVPAIEGYIGTWESYQSRIDALTGDVTIKPIYVLEEYKDDTNHVHVDSTMNAKQLFQYIAEGKSVIMGSDITGNGSQLGINGGSANLCEVASGAHGRLNLNSYKLTCNFDHNAKNAWHVFYVNNNATLTIAKGVADDGRLVVNFPGIKDDVYLFDVQEGGTLILEAGVTIEINYTRHKAGDNVNVYGFLLGGELNSFADYDGIYVDKSVEGKITITVGITTTITSAGVTQNYNHQ